MHRHRELELNLVSRGVATYMLRDRRYEMGVGSAVWLFPGQDHVLSHRSSDMCMWVIVFKPRLVARVCTTGPAVSARQQNPQGVFCRTLDQADAVRLHDLAQSVLDSAGNDATFNAGLAFLLQVAWNVFDRAQHRPGGDTVHPAVRAAAHLLTKPDCPESVDEIADQVGLSSTRLSHLFRQQMGLRLVDFRNRVRLERFLTLYGEGTRLKMLAAALRAGFGSYAQFHRVFTTQMGCGPREHFPPALPSTGD